MSFWVCYYHLIWATKNRALLITPQIESALYEIITNKSQSLGSPVFAVNGLEDHIHLAVPIAPKWSVAEWVQKVKGASSREINLQFPNLENSLYWQTGYGVLTFGKQTIPFIEKYIHEQKEHHAKKTAIPYLEQIEETDEFN